MYYKNITIEIKKTADPSARSFEAYYYRPTLFCHGDSKNPKRIETSIDTRSLKSAVFRSIVLANELTSEKVEPIIEIFDEYGIKTNIDSQELLVDALGKFEINRIGFESTNKFSLGKLKIKKEINK